MRFILLVLMTALALSGTGCSSYLTKNGRQQASYERYVRRQSAGRIKNQRKFLSSAKNQPIPSTPSEPQTSLSTGPESVTSGDESQ